MDFSSLDLLASTALRDNSPTHTDSTNTPSEPHHPQNNHHDSVENDEDDDEADGYRDSVKETDSTSDGEDLTQKEMGSVKCGKHKKNSAKPMSIFVRDGKCVAKHLATDTACHKETGSEMTGDSNRTGPHKVNSTEQEGDSNPQNITVLCNMAPKSPTQTVDREVNPGSTNLPVCNGVSSSDLQTHTKTMDESAPQETLGERCATADLLVVSPKSESSHDPLVISCTKPAQDSGRVTERNCDGASAQSSSDSSPTPVVACEAGEKDSGGQHQEKQVDRKCLHTEAGSGQCNWDSPSSVLHSVPDTQSSEVKSPVEKGKDIDSTPPAGKNLVSKVPDTAVESRTFSNCDVSCSQTEVKADEENSPCTKNSLDQNTGSSGNKDSQPPTDADNSQVKNILSPPPPPPRIQTLDFSVALLDHTYCFRSKVRLLENTDDSGDAFESADENVSADEIERRPRSLSVDSMYLQYNVAGLPSQQEALTQNDKLGLLSPTLSVDSISNDSSLSEHSTTAGGQCYSILVGSPNPKGTRARQNHPSADSPSCEKSGEGVCRTGTSVLGADANSSVVDTNTVMAVGPKCGKFRIGTFGSFSNYSHLELEKDNKKSKVKNGLSTDPVIKPFSSPAVASPGSPFPLLQSPGLEWDRSDAGSEAPDDLDSSTTEDKFLSSSHDSEAFGTTVSQVWRHPVFHDHDYCSKEVSEEYLGKPVAPTPQLKSGKRKYVKKKDRQDYEEEKLKKGKYLKRELLKQDNRFNLGAGRGMENRTVAARSSLLAESLTTKPNPVGRPRKRTEKQLEEYDTETGTKMKITGKYQDQYVYYLNKSSRNRRRKVDEKMPPGDKIILPAPKPGDIVVPHLSDADCEAIRRGGRMALLNSGPHPVPSVQLPHTDSGDMDSSIVNTILSMETEHGNLQSPLPVYDGVGHSEDFADIEGNLTSEQVKMLFDCLEMEETTTSQELDLFTTAEAVSAPSTTVDSLAVTSVAEDLMVPPCTTTTSESVSLLAKADPSSPEQVKLEQDSLSCDMKADLESSESKPLVHSMPAPPTSQPSVEKNLEFLKTPFFPESSSATSYPESSVTSSFPESVVVSSGSHGLFSPAPMSTLMGPLPDSKSDDVNETPWIVTVTLYWNDIPAIVINNVPHVRLVDIHRQILPAKDTGILKKRCQLMNIQVSNCSEMQRYFLVQYGRAHNSKSTLVISKDEAQRLITYYAHPPPRNLRGEEGGGLRRSSSYAELRSIMERPNSVGRHPTLPFNQPRKKGGFRRRPLPTRSHNPSPEPVPAPVLPVMEPLLVSPPLAAPTSPAKGLRHKKINFREMLKGEDSSSQLSPLTDEVEADDCTLEEEAAVVKGRGSKAPAVAGAKKRRGPKEPGVGPPAKRGRRAWRKKSEGKEAGPKTAVETKVVAKETPSPVMGAKNKKRSPGSSAAGTLSASGRSPKSKYGPIKVNVKSLVSSMGSLADGSQPRKKNLFGRKPSSTDVVVDGPEEAAAVHPNPLRVLKISHQDMEATSPPTPHVLSPTAEVHLDLYNRASSPCVKCRTCHKFLSVADFLKHQHVSGEGGKDTGSKPQQTDVGPGGQRRILVPMNKENISLEEQRLWNEFVALQESLDHSASVASMGAYPLTPLSPASPVGSSANTFGDVHSPGVDHSHLMTMTPESPHPPPCCLHNGHQMGLDMETAAQPVVMDTTAPVNTDPCSASDPHGILPFPSESYPWDSQLQSSPSPLSPPLPTCTQKEEKCLLNNVDSSDREVQSNLKPVTAGKKQWSLQRQRRNSPNNTNIRTSSRKRETKRLYSFEKYEFSVGGKKGGRGETDTQDLVDDLPDSLMDDGRVAINSTVLHLASDTLQEPQNA
ncbi:uncharacterized protein LOC143293367 [Babylonia areolata]|uniref:uncharacterized protein LOC143293367 n=1 Tax=Babylonia areolata TaxID=304850 RepID=UPI003FD51CB5